MGEATASGLRASPASVVPGVKLESWACKAYVLAPVLSLWPIKLAIVRTLH